ncbi:RGG repeats nuclear RNA binding protein A-like [Salvia splendens]|uniref:RGG repeats nuclear RNA binding protein A-like n=1 Tax=Salvia splendens TaxID=180675 RepID=UPI001C275462|nr:RGG repeats nuclear RNA binding protein A-like [Salvia splendens]
MATANPFDLLGDDDDEDPSLLVAAQQQKIDPKKAGAPAKAAAVKQPPPQAKLPTKPLPPAQAVREAESARGGRGGARGRGRGSYRDSPQNNNSYGNREVPAGRVASDDADAEKSYESRGGYGGPRGSFRGGRRGGFSNGDGGEGDRPRRPLDRRSGTGYGYEPKREGAGRGNWGTQTDELANVAEGVVTEGEKVVDVEKPSGEDAPAAADGEKEASRNEVEEKEAEDKEMTLDEYEKILEEKRKALQALKTDSRKVDVKEFESMQQLSNKKAADDVFIKLGSEKDKKELAEKEERAKKSVSINEFLKPADGEKYYNPGRGRGRGRGGPRGGYGGGSETSTVRAPAIEDPGQFPTLGGK